MSRSVWVASALALVVGCVQLGCPPMGPIPGGRLSGERVDQQVADWSFTDEIKNIQLETRPDAPYSVTTWCAAHDGGIYVGSGGGDKTSWARYLLDDARVRVRIEGKIYDRSAVRVTSADEIQAVLRKLEMKYNFEMDDDDAAEGLLFRMDPR